MQPDTPFYTPQSSFKNPVPFPGTEPTSGPLVCVAFNASWLPYIIGCLYQLGQQTTFISHSQDEFQHQQQLVAELWNIFVLALPCSPVNFGYGKENDMPFFREVCENGKCFLEFQCCPDEWVRLANVDQITANGQPSAPVPQPKPGTSQQVCGTIYANQPALVPFVVSAGDVVSITATGAGNDGGTATWYCPDGSMFFAGLCDPVGQIHDGSDPLPSAFHMSLILNVNGTYYDLSSPVTIGAGVSNVQPTIQVNDSGLSNNSGSYQVCTTVQNNQAVTFVHDFNFELESGGFMPNNVFVVSGATGHWSAGAGWLHDDCVLVAANNDYRIVRIVRSFTPTTITKLIATFDTVAGGTNVGSGDYCEFYAGDDHETSPFQTVTFASQPNGTGQTLVWSGSMSLSALDIFLASSYFNDGSYHGSMALKALHVEGNGADPF